VASLRRGNVAAMAVYRVKIRWAGFSGAPGYTNLHFDAPTEPTTAGAQAVYDAAHTFAEGITSAIPNVVSLTVESGVEIVDQDTNQLITILSATPKPNLTGLQTTGFSSATGACITWETGEVKNGRRVRGRTFIVPISSTYYQTDGTLASTVITDLVNAATALAGGGFSFGILSRPSVEGAADGSFHTVSSGRVADKTAILRSRRD
jgi:hypothetical protein